MNCLEGIVEWCWYYKRMYNDYVIIRLWSFNRMNNLEKEGSVSKYSFNKDKSKNL